MVVMDLPGLLAERGVPAHVWPRNLVTLPGQDSLRRRVTRRQFNPESCAFVPVGYVPCKSPCRNFAEIDYEANTAECPEGHVLDLDEECQEFGPGGGTWVGLTLKQQGDIGEEIVKKLKKLGEWGNVDEWCKEYNAPLDGITDLGWGIEVKTKSTRAKKHCFEPGNKKSRARKLAEAEKRNLKGILEVLVILDFELSKARIFIKAKPRGKQLRFWSMPTDPPFAVVDFTDLNPFVPSEDKEREKTEIPF